MNASRVLVTGGGGFLGSWVLDRLADEYDAAVFDRRRDARPFEQVLGDVRDAVSVDTAVKDFDAVIHLAGLLGTQETIEYADGPVQTNVLGTLNVLNACRRHGTRMVYISVGNWWMNNPYSISKHTAERFCLMYRKEFDMPVSVVRALNAYGPRQKDHPVRKIVPTFINRALAGEPIQVYGDGEQVADMIFAADVADILVRALEWNPAGVIEAGTGVPTTVNQVARAVLDAVGSGEIEHLPMRPGEDVGAVVLADTSTLFAVGKKPSDLVQLGEGLRRTVEWHVDQSST